MNISTETLAILKNFSEINQNILFRPGKKLNTISQGKNILAEADITEKFDAEFGVYDLPEFLIPQREIFKKFIELCDLNKVSQIKCCLDYAKQISWSSGIVVGINRFSDMTDVIKNFSSAIKVKDFSIDVLSDFYSDPRNWINL